VDAPERAVLRVPLLVAPLPGNEPAGCGILGSSWIPRLAICTPAPPAVRCGTGAASWERFCVPAVPGFARVTPAPLPVSVGDRKRSM